MKQVGEKKLPQIVLYCFITFSALISIFPFYWMFVMGSNTTSDVNKIPPVVLPGANFIKNAQIVFERIDFFGAIWNSLLISTAVTVSVLFFSSLAGFAFAKLEFKGRDFMFIFLLATMMIPPQLSLIPNFMLISKLGWVDDVKAVIVPGMVSAFGVFWMRQYISSAVPYELIEASRIDGCSNFRTYWNIVIPAVRPGLATLGIVTFMGTWNDFLWPLVVLKDQASHTIQIALRTLNDVYFTDYSMILAGTFLATIPILIVFIIFNRQFIAGITDGAVKN
ncbi:carbohydrate ABC transporter permease [Lederbergia galactosidilytica]|uniref:Sugar ABC transporter permease n=1 Tax=Lederbergia galactosidilytica TaxID=217031 RepID=A0A0Q9XR95_9BACI|nr:carbohydrate ABC transporter permease [Lederbergia galactosidilytica]KRG09833.1 sugar ABC transporter permease [Lederbergia galactosidilytica]KRG15309.1 sugar ABC transporter permease [Virgibacillus soli]MBP1915990.1 cellobiose transport system permease protein [Lederbergia galactosidilytica]OAK71276.1 sugar ABC transporter permease [Lederbergia galactosidilytica]